MTDIAGHGGRATRPPLPCADPQIPVTVPLITQ